MASHAFSVHVADSEPVRSRTRVARFPHPTAEEMLQRIQVLERAAIFYTLPDAELRAIARRLRPLTLAPGEIALEAGRTADSIFFVEAGTCQIRSEGWRGGSMALGVLRPGDLFGEGCLFTDAPSELSVVAVEETHLLALDRQAVLSLFPPDADAVRQLRRFDAQRRLLYHDMLTQANWGQLVHGGVVVAIYSPKGGSGRTSLALNLGAALAARHPRDVLVLDLAFPYNHAALMANLVPAGCLARTAAAAPDDFEDGLLSASLYHPVGMMVLPGGIRPEEAELVGGNLVGRALEVLRRTFAFVVVDMGVSIDEVALAVFDQAQHVIVVATPELTAVKGVTDAVQILEKLGIAPDRIDLVLNHRDARPAVSKEALERRLGRAVDLEIRHDGDRPDRAALSGSMLSGSDPKSELGRGAIALADRLEAAVRAGQPVPEPPAGASPNLGRPE